MLDTAVGFANFRQIKQQIDTLTKQQADALRAATRIGMTPDEAKECDSRGLQITALLQRLFEWQSPR